MQTKQIGRNLFQIDLETGGFKNLICSYVIKGVKIILVESGPTSSVPNLISGLKELKINFADIEYVAITHIHLDHGGGAGTLLKLLPNAKILVHPRGMPHLVNTEQLWLSSQKTLGFVSGIFGKPEPIPEERLIPITDGSFHFGNGGKFKVSETVGHASHNLSFYESLNNGVFPGDAAGTYFPEFDVVIPTSPPPFHLDSALASIDKLIGLNPTVLYFSHFGKAINAVQRLKDYRMQLQLWAKIAKEGVRKNLSLEEIRNRIIAEDTAMQQIATYLKGHRIYSRTALRNSIQGFIENAKRSEGNGQA